MEPYEKPVPIGRTIGLEREEMWHALKKKRHKRWLWKALDRDTGQRLDWECGCREKATLKKLVNRRARWEVPIYGPDKWGR
jgi:IS1 family transposase